jgi:bacillithiol biosynthesis cysteine-adding enzyme BshC
VLPQSGVSDPAPARPGVRGGDGASGARLAVDIRRFPWIRALAADYAFDYARVADFFAGNPEDPAAWREAIGRTQRHARDRAAIAGILNAQQQRRGAAPEAVAAARRLADGQTVAVVTGQQAGLFGGPLFTLLKALTALRLAEQVREEHGVPAVAIFWIDAEDHDWDEVKACSVLDGDLAVRPLTAGTPPAAHQGPVAGVKLDQTIAGTLDELEAALPPTEFSPQVLDGLRRAYRPGAGMADAFAQWIEQVLGPRGLIVYDASDPAAKPLAAKVFERELAHPGDTARLAKAAGAALAARGYHAQVTPQEDSVALFHLAPATALGASAREAIRRDGASFVVGDRVEPAEALLAQVRTEPQRFSPNVLLRPLVQDTLFPTVCYVAGPNELAYLGQLGRVYEAFGIPMPLMQQRASATIVDSNGMRFLSRHDVPFEALRAQDEAALNALLESQLPPSVEGSLHDALRAIEERMGVVAAEVPQIDPTLEGAARSTLARMLDDLKKLHAKIIQAAKRKDDTLRRQYHHARAQVFPGGHPQEREIGFVYFLNKYGPTLVDRLSDELPIDMGTHWVVTI